MVVDVKTTRY